MIFVPENQRKSLIFLSKWTRYDNDDKANYNYDNDNNNDNNNYDYNNRFLRGKLMISFGKMWHVYSVSKNIWKCPTKNGQKTPIITFWRFKNGFIFNRINSDFHWYLGQNTIQVAKKFDKNVWKIGQIRSVSGSQCKRFSHKTLVRFGVSLK